jgi:hypothetical protein
MQQPVCTPPPPPHTAAAGPHLHPAGHACVQLPVGQLAVAVPVVQPWRGAAAQRQCHMHTLTYISAAQLEVKVDVKQLIG